MKGHTALIAMRRNGRRPIGGVLVDTAPGADRWHRDWEAMSMPLAFVDIDPADSLHDLRFAVGLDVQVSGEDPVRVGEVAKAFVGAGAKRVIAGVGRYVGEEYRCERFAFGNEEILQWQT